MLVVAVGLLPGVTGCRQILGFDEPEIAADAPIASPNDRDTDGVSDDLDNCPDVANASQGDEDSDTAGNACDNCPHIANPGQANVGEIDVGLVADGVGDACDPKPTETGQNIALFLPFEDPAEIAAWQVAGSAAVFVVENGRLEQRGATSLGLLWHDDLGLTNAWISTEVTYGVIDTTKQFRGVAVMSNFERKTDFGHGAGCGEISDGAFDDGTPFYGMVRFGGSGFSFLPLAMGAVVEPGHTVTYSVRRVDGDNYECRATPGTLFTGSATLDTEGTGINLAVWGATASFDYLIAIE